MSSNVTRLFPIIEITKIHFVGNVERRKAFTITHWIFIKFTISLKTEEFNLTSAIKLVTLDGPPCMQSCVRGIFKFDFNRKSYCIFVS